jgi:hypothetical protein
VRGCRECCWYNRVGVDPQEEPAENLKHLAIEIDNDGFALKKHADGACIHLGDQLSITHNFRSDHGTERDVGQPG